MVIENGAGDAALPSSTELALDRTLLAHDRTGVAAAGHVATIAAQEKAEKRIPPKPASRWRNNGRFHLTPRNPGVDRGHS